MRDKYEKTVSLKHSERISEIVDLDTGEVRKPRDSHLPDGKILFDNGYYVKVYVDTLGRLLTHLDSSDSHVLMKMISSISFNTNEIIPITDTTFSYLLADFFGVSKFKIVSSLDKLHELSVYKKGFELPIGYNNNPIKHWVFNPYIASSGKMLDDKLVKLFDNFDYNW